MRPTPLFLRCACAALLVTVLASCGPGPAPSSLRSKQQLNGPPDLAAGKTPDPRWRSFQLRSFQMNHVWAGNGYASGDGSPYRAKLTLWDYAEDGAPLAEVFFYDAGISFPANPDPNKDTKRPYALRFPAGAIGPILQALRNSNEPVYLFYYDNQWAVGISAVEPVGVD